MANITTPITLTAALEQGVTKPEPLPVRLILGNAGAHTLRIACSRDGTAADLTGVTATAYVKRADDITIAVPAAVDGSEVSATLTGACYEAAGFATISIELAQGDIRATHLVCTAYVEAARTDREEAPCAAFPNAEEVAF